MKRLKNTVLSLTAMTLMGSIVAHADEQAIKQSFSKSMPTLKIDSIKPAEVKGLYEVTVGSNILYVSEDGKY